MSKESMGKKIADTLFSDVSKWWTWGEILEKILPGFSMEIPRRLQAGIVRTYMQNLVHAREIIDSKEAFLLRRGRSLRASFKIATTNDLPFITSQLNKETKIRRDLLSLTEARKDNLIDKGILPEGYHPGAQLPT